MQIPGYRIIRKINQGGMSTVYLAIQLSVGREVALKVMSPVLNSDPVFSERFQREANIVGQLSHPNIVSIYDIGQHKGLNYIAMDYLPGGSIHDKMAAGLSAREALRIAREIAHALDHAHEKGYIHRDIKPENILFREDDSAVLSDFGVAKTINTASRMTNAGTVVGTPHYMSPEQTRGKPVDGRADIYSLGVVLYEMLTGSVPYQAEEAVAIAIKHLTAPIPKLPPQYQVYQKILNQLLAKDPDDRFQRGRDLVAAIDALSPLATPLGSGYTPATDPSNVQVLSLLRALLATCYAALLYKLQQWGHNIASWRWTPQRGLYRRPRVRVTEVLNAPGGVSEKTTVVATRVQKAAHYQAIRLHRNRRISRGLTALVIVGLLWSAFSLAINKYQIPGERLLPDTLARWAHTTAHWIQPGRSADQQKTASLAEPGEAEESALLVASQHAVADSPPEEAQADAPPEPPVAAPPPRFALSVQVQPENARVRILNIPDRYFPGIELMPGRYHVEVTHRGYDMHTEWVQIDREPVAINVSLRRTPVAGATFANELTSGARGPEMVIVPAGIFTMGSTRDTNSMPERRVRIPEAFAISRFEVTFADYAHFAEATGRDLPSDNRWGRGNRPVINVSWEDAQAYVTWLTRETGARYRLPSEAEWEYAARGGTESLFWWGEEIQGADGMANCRRGCNSEHAGLFGSRTAPVGAYPANPFGLHDTSGNVSEWVQDCYLGHHLGAPRDTSPIEQNECPARVIRGGSMSSNANQIASHYRAGLAPDSRQSTVGFRVLVELY